MLYSTFSKVAVSCMYVSMNESCFLMMSAMACTVSVPSLAFISWTEARILSMSADVANPKTDLQISPKNPRMALVWR